MICAIIRDDIVVEVKDLTEQEIQETYRAFNVESVENYDPIPKTGWHRVSGKLIDPDLVGNNGFVLLTKEGFFKRFTDAEMVSIEAFMAEGPTPFRYYVRALNSRFNRLTYVDRSLPAVLSGLQFLVSCSILASDRTLEILNAPSTGDDVYRGK